MVDDYPGTRIWGKGPERARYPTDSPAFFFLTSSHFPPLSPLDNRESQPDHVPVGELDVSSITVKFLLWTLSSMSFSSQSWRKKTAGPHRFNPIMLQASFSTLVTVPRSHRAIPIVGFDTCTVRTLHSAYSHRSALPAWAYELKTNWTTKDICPTQARTAEIPSCEEMHWSRISDFHAQTDSPPYVTVANIPDALNVIL
ncbi:hypothetical protein Hypma_002751 [Hypsizygus marmoreus]|uniref:Uncharacterized protein n=1 Tax=Hypsizygus marmoreus TaxID=39966 RepID=A0A369J368_HYPMA|nr:hypothetical protein Hypma_002751 [Hypsizygus marmoreus]